MRRDRIGELAQGGYNLVALMVIVGVILVFLGMAVPAFEVQLQRQREEEALFRGLQIAEALRVFQLRQGRLPLTLEELLEVEPRSIRQLWTDPLSEDGSWGLIRGAGVPLPGQEPPEVEGRGGGGDDGEDEEEDDEEDEEDEDHGSLVSSFSLGREEPSSVALGPISGVFSRASGAALIRFNGKDVYKEWQFTPQILPKPVVAASGELVTRANAATVGRAFLYGLAPALVAAPEELEAEGEDLLGSGQPLEGFGDEEEGGDEGDEEDGGGEEDE